MDTTTPDRFKQVYICGLDGDFKRNKFGQLLDLIPYCDNVTKLHSICKRCLNNDVNNAIFSHRVTGEKDQTLIGSSAYIPLCRSCYLQENKEDFTTLSHTISL